MVMDLGAIARGVMEDGMFRVGFRMIVETMSEGMLESQ
jgi:hypothetical protein